MKGALFQRLASAAAAMSNTTDRLKNKQLWKTVKGIDLGLVIQICKYTLCKSWLWYSFSLEIILSESNFEFKSFPSLTPSLRRPYINAIFSTACRTACKHAFRFLRVLPEAVSTRHSWLWQTLDDVYTRRCFSESEGTHFGAPGQKALPSVNEFTLLWIFA